MTPKYFAISSETNLFMVQVMDKPLNWSKKISICYLKSKLNFICSLGLLLWSRFKK